MNMINQHVTFLVVASFLVGPPQPTSHGQTAPDDTPVFSAAQASQGKAEYQKNCASCHGDDLAGIHLAPSLKGARFDRNWRGKPAGTLAFHLRRMPMKPAGEPGSLTDESYINILTYILSANGFTTGDVPMSSDPVVLAETTIPRLSGADYDPDAPITPSAKQQELLANLPTLSDQMLHHPSDEDWLYWGRTDNGHNFSPLKQIDRTNVGDLRLAWRAPLRDGGNMPAPLVHQGIMFLQTFPDAVLALDASSGDVLWRHQYEPTTGFSTKKMGLGLHGSKVLVPTTDLHVRALDAKTGKLIWDHKIAPEAGLPARTRYELRSAPFVAGNHVIQGVMGIMQSRGGFILALDLETGQEAWRFNTIARPGTPGGNSWNGLELDRRSGGSVWHQGTYDPELNLIYYGAAPTYDTGPLLKASNRSDVTNDALYTNCTLAINPDTGKLVWHYQHMANDQWDLDWVFERQIATVKFNGRDRKIVMNVGKIGILEALDAATGEYLFSIDAGVQNVIASIDEVTGKKTYNPDVTPDPAVPCTVCPSAFGARSWPTTSYSPQTKFVYAPLANWCMEMGPKGLKILTSGVGLLPAPPPNFDGSNIGRLQAYDVQNRKLAWSVDQRAPLSTSVISTAGGVVFSADLSRTIQANDDSSGKVLWQAKLDDLPSSSIITYAADDKQFVSVVVGQENRHVSDLGNAYDQVLAQSGQASHRTPGGGAAIWTFALNEVVQEWTLQDLAAALTEADHGRSYDNGQKVFESASCKACHGLAGQESKLGLNLQQISQKIRAGKIDRAGLLSEILQPSAKIDEKFRTQVIATKAGNLVSGVIVHEDDTTIRLLSNPLNAGERPKEVAKSEIDQRSVSPVSLMPMGLLNTLNKEDILDLLAYIESGGDPESKAFRQ